MNREALRRAGVWLPERVDEMILRLRNGEGQLDYQLGLVLSVQILYALFIEKQPVGDPELAMVDRTPVTPPGPGRSIPAEQ